MKWIAEQKLNENESASLTGVLHIFVDKASPNGNVYVKCPSVAAAFKSVNALHGRWFSGF